MRSLLGLGPEHELVHSAAAGSSEQDVITRAAKQLVGAELAFQRVVVVVAEQLVVATITLLKTENSSGVTVHIPIIPKLQIALDAGPIGDLNFIVGKRGQPYTKEAFGNMFRRWCAAAGVKASAHGLRKLAATDLAEAGGSEKELQAAFGWRTNTQSAVYTRTAEDRRLAIQAARKRAGNKTAHTFAPEPPTPEKK